MAHLSLTREDGRRLVKTNCRLDVRGVFDDTDPRKEACSSRWRIFADELSVFAVSSAAAQKHVTSTTTTAYVVQHKRQLQSTWCAINANNHSLHGAP